MSSSEPLKRCISYRNSVLGSDRLSTSSNIPELQNTGGWSAYVKYEVFVSLIFDSKIKIFYSGTENCTTVSVTLDGNLELASRC